MKFKKQAPVIHFAIIMILIAIANTAVAEMKTEDAIKFRQSGMMFMRWNMGKIKSAVNGNPQAFDKDKVINAANVIAAIANSNLGSLFNEKSKTGKGWKETRVKADYFQQPQEVGKYAKAFNTEANKLAQVAKTGSIGDIKTQFDTLFSACKDCHKKYRSKD